VVDFRNTVLILTSNIGTKLLKKGAMGFSTKEEFMDHDRVKDQVLTEMKKVFNPEFINRFDETLVFHSLTPADIRQIIDILLVRTNERLLERRIQLHLSEPVRDFLVEHGYDSEYGARPLRRAIQQYIEDPLSSLLLEGRIKKGDNVEAVLDDGGLVTFETRSNGGGDDDGGEGTPDEAPVGSSTGSKELG
ncbi:ATP-dependent Clp protease ATP-binding subunit, partial [bacterium]|nr:ATP-dependent Clp protease ATP-binding subunit [bacterium]